jgi:hypothetical protein
MKKLLILFFLLGVTTLGFAQTRPHWLQIAGKPFSDPRSYGAKFDGTTNDFSGISSAIQAGGLVTLGDNTLISGVGNTQAVSEAIPVSRDVTIMGGNVTIDGEAGLYLAPVADNITITIDGVRLDGQSTQSNHGIFIRNDGEHTGVRLIVRNCVVKNIYPDGANTRGSGGIGSMGEFDSVVFENNYVENVRRAIGAVAGSQSAKGIFATETTGDVYIQNNRIIDILSNAVDGYMDADSIAVFTPSTNWDKAQHNVVITGNYIKNASGRFIKLQTPSAKVTDNHMIMDPTEGLLANSSGVDAQTGGLIFSGNRMEFLSPTIPDSYRFLTTTVRHALNISVDVNHNTFVDERTSPYYSLSVFLYGVDPVPPSHIKITDNVIFPNVCYFLDFDNDVGYDTATPTISLEVSRNRIEGGGQLRAILKPDENLDVESQASMMRVVVLDNIANGWATGYRGIFSIQSKIPSLLIRGNYSEQGYLALHTNPTAVLASGTYDLFVFEPTSSFHYIGNNLASAPVGFDNDVYIEVRQRLGNTTNNYTNRIYHLIASNTSRVWGWGRKEEKKVTFGTPAVP